MILKTVRVLMGNEVRQFRDSEDIRAHFKEKNYEIIDEVHYKIEGWQEKAMLEINTFKNINGKNPTFLILGHNVYHEMEKETETQRKVGYAMLNFCGLTVIKVIEPDFIGVA